MKDDILERVERGARAEIWFRGGRVGSGVSDTRKRGGGLGRPQCGAGAVEMDLGWLGCFRVGSKSGVGRVSVASDGIRLDWDCVGLGRV